MSRRTEVLMVGAIALLSLGVATWYTHFELSLLTGLLLAIASKGIRRRRYHQDYSSQDSPDI
ncbi:MAG: hypothetical protein KFF72_07970 [Arthrospira sp. SH-MAG29]|nr:hypothetical protein [Arthrospira sp. SH-MAG29]MBS0016286.1 hypothetical protein [Arthrospira sp. SH-MAG29]